MNHRKPTDPCSLFRDDVCAQQAGGDTSPWAKEELKRSSHSVDSCGISLQLTLQLIPLTSGGNTLVDIKQRSVSTSTNPFGNDHVLVLHRLFRFIIMCSF